MTNTNDARHAHEVLDGLSAGRILSRVNEQLLRSFLPDLPKQKTLEELYHEVYDAWVASNGDEWVSDGGCSTMSLEDWLRELHEQLRGLKDTPAAAPVLPAGMRLADHAEYGRVVSIGRLDEKGDYFCVYYDKNYKHGIYTLLEADSLTFVDAESAKPAHPEFLLTEGSYYAAPPGTIVTRPGRFPWVKEEGGDWSCSGGTDSDNAMAKSGQREVLRWGWGE